jgi:hypothetical protein
MKLIFLFLFLNVIIINYNQTIQNKKNLLHVIRVQTIQNYNYYNYKHTYFIKIL